MSEKLRERNKNVDEPRAEGFYLVLLEWWSQDKVGYRWKPAEWDGVVWMTIGSMWKVDDEIIEVGRRIEVGEA